MPKPTRQEIRDAVTGAIPLAGREWIRNPVTTASVVHNVEALVDAEWAKTERELARGRKADIILSRWLPSHDAKCQKRRPLDSVEYQRALSGAPVLLACTCGLDDALAQLRESAPAFVARMEVVGAERVVGIRHPDTTRRTTWAYVSDGEPAMTSSTGEGEKAPQTDRHSDAVASNLDDFLEGEDWEEYNRLQRARRAGYELALYATQYPMPQERARLAAEAFPLKKRTHKVIPDPHGAGEWTFDGESFVWRNGHPEFRAFPNGMLWSAERIRVLAVLLDDPWEWVDDSSVEEDPA